MPLFSSLSFLSIIGLKKVLAHEYWLLYNKFKSPHAILAPPFLDVQVTDI